MESKALLTSIPEAAAFSNSLRSWHVAAADLVDGHTPIGRVVGDVARGQLETLETVSCGKPSSFKFSGRCLLLYQSLNSSSFLQWHSSGREGLHCAPLSSRWLAKVTDVLEGQEVGQFRWHRYHCSYRSMKLVTTFASSSGCSKTIAWAAPSSTVRIESSMPI
jgi:hypothetical protein